MTIKLSASKGPLTLEVLYNGDEITEVLGIYDSQYNDITDALESLGVDCDKLYDVIDWREYYAEACDGWKNYVTND